MRLTDDFSDTLGCLVADASHDLAARLGDIHGLRVGEQAIILSHVRESIVSVLHAKLARVLLLEMHAARDEGRLVGSDERERWHAFIAMASRIEFWRSLSIHYPTLWERIDHIVANRCAAALAFAQHFAGDRQALDAFHNTALGPLVSLAIGAGDSHRGGSTVVIVTCRHGKVVYKPRPVSVDVALRRFVAGLQDVLQGRSSMRVPRVIDRGGYGWAEFIQHRYAADANELGAFYRGIGQWLAVMRLLGGTDLHAENLIAHGPSPVVVDCETLFAPRLPHKESGLGNAYDRASAMIGGSVLNMGLLPGRGAGLGWRGVDSSGVGALPGQQPKVEMPVIVEGGTDRARLGTALVELRRTRNHPGERPVLAEHWADVLEGFDTMTASLRRLDDAGLLLPRLAIFAHCDVRVVVRATEVYAEIARMLWHPVSLHQPEDAITRAKGLLARMAENRSLAPSEEAVIAAEVDDLLDGDVPYFAMRVDDGVLHGSHDVHWLPASDRIDEALRHWRDADLVLERQVIQATLASAYANEGWVPPEVSLRPTHLDLADLDARRRRQAASILRDLMASAIRGDDGSVAWIASVLGPTGRSVQPLAQDLYGGLGGIALLAAGYLREMEAGRADEVAGIDAWSASLTRTMRMAETQLFLRRAKVERPRPIPPGGLIGLGSQIWTWLALDHVGAARGEGVDRACALAELIPEGAAADDMNDLLTGKAGAIVPLLQLADASGDRRFRAMAADLGDSLIATATFHDDKAWWPHARWPDGLGGFAHGASGIGWALERLARATGAERFAAASRAAMAFDDGLFDPEARGWRDLRGLGGSPTAAAWCHGAVGIGLALADLDPDMANPRTREKLRHAAAAAWQQGMGVNHGLCHGDFGAWELLDLAIRNGVAPDGLSTDRLLATVISSLEVHGPRCGMTGDTPAPGMLSGVAGVVWQLLRAHADASLPSVMCQGDVVQTSTRSAQSDSVPSPPPMAVAASTSLG